MYFKITIANTTFSYSTLTGIKAFLLMERAKLHFIGLILFNSISNINNTIIFAHNTEVTSSDYTEFTNITGRTIFEYSFNAYPSPYISLFVIKDSVINVTSNKFKTFASIDEHSLQFRVPPFDYPPCYFQYLDSPKIKC